MIPLIKKFFNDETAFIRFTRAGVFAAGAIVKYMGEGTVPNWVGMGLMAASLLLTAGEPNPKPPVEPEKKN